MFSIQDVGCWADGAGGHERIRMIMGNMLAKMHRHHPRGGEGIYWKEVEPIIKALDQNMSDDAWEEQEALEWLNKDCERGCHFEFIDGDLMLINHTE